MDVEDEIPADITEGGVLKDQINSEQVVYNVCLLMRGYQYDPAKEAYIKLKGVEPWLNEDGISKISAVLRARISNINAYSRLSKDQITCIRESVGSELWFNLTVKYKEYNLDIINLYLILDIVDDSLLLFLSRTESGGFSKFIKGLFKGSESYAETSTETEDTKNSKGILGGLFN